MQPSGSIPGNSSMSSFFSQSALRLTLRRLSKQRGFALTVLLTLGLCIGANIVIFSIVDAILLRPLPFIKSEGLITASNAYPGAGVEKSSASLPNYYDRKEGIDSFESVSIIQYGSAIVGENGAPIRVKRDRISPDLFETLGVQLLMGRTFTEDEMLPENSRKSILTYRFWQRYFDGDPQILGKTFDLEGNSNEVVGVLPKGFQFLSSKAEFYVPAASNLKDREPINRHSNNYFFIARLKKGTSLKVAQSQMDGFNISLMESDPVAHLLKGVGFRTYIHDLREDHVASIKSTLILLQTGVFCLLLIGGVNIANLFLIRASTLSKEVAVRQALGAGRRDILSSTLYETLSLTIIGGLLGIGIGAFGIRMMGHLGIDKLPLGAGVTLDTRVVFVGIAGSCLVGIVLAIPVVWFHLKGQIATALQAESRSGTASRTTQRVRHSFIIAQIALTLVLLTCAGMMTVSLKKVMNVSPGFNPAALVTGHISLPHKRYPEEADRLAFIDRLLPAIEAIPGINKAAINTGLPFGGNNSDNAVVIEGQKYDDNNSIRAHYTSGVDGEYWKLMGIPLIEGRLLDAVDAKADTRVCLIDTDTAAFYWHDGESPVGKRLGKNVDFKEDEAYTIVGVVGRIKRNELGDQAAKGSIYFPYQHQSWNSFYLVVQAGMDPPPLMNTIRKTILELDSELPIDGLKTMNDRIYESLTTRRSPALLSTLFADVALLLAGIGTYGILAFAVAQRQKEVGVRMALGANPNQIRIQFLALGFRLLAIGLSIGLIGTWFASKAMNGLLYDMPVLHFASILSASVLMAVVSQLACLIPSIRASRVSPTVALNEGAI